LQEARLQEARLQEAPLREARLQEAPLREDRSDPLREDWWVPDP
jgi:uncharacterized protein YjbI with pentapeptide repeats